MSSQKDLFAKFYDKLKETGSMEAKRLGTQVFNLLKEQIMELRSYSEFEHKDYKSSAYFEVYLNVYKDSKQYLVPGGLLLSFTYLNRVRPVILLTPDRNSPLNFGIVNSDKMVDIAYMRKWKEHPDVFECIREVIKALQKDPYDYAADETEDDLNECKPYGLDKPSVEYNPNIPYSSIKKICALGEGSYGTVFKAEWNGKLVAVKEWHHHIGTGSSNTQFWREVDIQKCIHHPNCVELYGMSSTAEGKPVLIMDLCDGNLADYTTDRREKGYPELSNSEKRRIILEIAKGIAYLHSKGLVHRDIKSENILMKNMHPVIADFGFARTIDIGRSMAVSKVGTPLFMAPELAQGNRVTNTVDVYSFGCVVNEIISGNRCYSDFNLDGVTEKQFFGFLAQNLRPTIGSSVPMEVRYLLEDCYKNKSSRPSMDSLVKRIEAWDPSTWSA